LDPEQARHLGGWLVDQVGPAKRRCDVAGHYGLHGFLIVLPHTTPHQAPRACQRLPALLAPPPPPDAPARPPRLGLAHPPRPPRALLRVAEGRRGGAAPRPGGGVVAE